VEPEITVLISSSPIKSHPSTHIIDETITSIRERLPDQPVIVMQDGVRDHQADYRERYAEYLENLDAKWGDSALILQSANHMHQAAMTRSALAYVRTPVILFMEHDTPLTGPQIPWEELGRYLVNGDANVIRFMHESHVLPDHEHLTLDHGTPLTKSIQWSQRPHLARKDYYDHILANYFSDQSNTFIEDRMHGKLQELYDVHGLWDGYYLYTPEGDQKRSYHSDGRENEPKWDNELVY
jgi:hypothetical protein